MKEKDTPTVSSEQAAVPEKAKRPRFTAAKWAETITDFEKALNSAELRVSAHQPIDPQFVSKLIPEVYRRILEPVTTYGFAVQNEVDKKEYDVSMYFRLDIVHVHMDEVAPTVKIKL